MSEYKESSTISKIIGSAPGYVGYNDVDNILEKIKSNPFCIILLDEIEKACKEVINLRHLKEWHNKFQKFCDSNLPFKAQVYMGGKTGGNNRSIEELKLESKYQIEHQKVIELEKEREKLQEQITQLNEQLAKLTWDNSNTWGNTSTWGEYTYGA